MVKLYKGQPILNTTLMKQEEALQDNAHIMPDMTDINEARKAFIANEIFNRKY